MPSQYDVNDAAPNPANRPVDAHEDLHFVWNEERGLKAIIAVHSTHLGPAAGGCRYWRYEDPAEALTDALRLSRGMSYKNAMAGLPLGGGKSVIIADDRHPKSPETLHVFGDLVVFLDDTESAARARRDRLDALLDEPYTSDALIFACTPAGLADLLLELREGGLSGFRLRPADPAELATLVLP